MTKIIVNFVDEELKKVPRSAIQIHKVYTIELLHVSQEDRFEEIIVTAKICGSTW